MIYGLHFQLLQGEERSVLLKLTPVFTKMTEGKKKDQNTAC